MLLKDHEALWIKIREFPLNEPGAAITFSKKLQEQQKWTASFTERVIEEYRRFIFLCCIAPKGASPSKAVDEAWHLHLTYTRSYWIDFCKNTLGKDIHHNPSKGGTQEHHKHINWYKDTLELYKEVFGYGGPADIWPDPSIALIPEPTVKVSAASIAIGVGIFLLPFFGIHALFGTPNPFALNGGQFLVFYPIFVLFLITSFYVLQRERRAYYFQMAEEYMEKYGSIYQKTKFLYGSHRALQTGIVDLVRRDLLTLESDKKFTVNKRNYKQQADEQNPLIPGLLREDNGYTLSYDLLDARWYEDGRFTHPALAKLHLFAYREKNFWQKYGLMIIVGLVALARFIQGLYNQEAVGFLFLEALAMWVLVYYARRVFFRNFNVFYMAEVKFDDEAPKLHPDELVSGFAMNGTSALRSFANGYILIQMFAGYKNASQASVFGSSGACSSCSGGGGGGSSCSGCGGSGCGGCGGGGD